MATSYPQGGRGVKAPGAPASSAAKSAAPSPRERERETATFVPYYWEAYNEIVEPRRFDHYLITRWLTDLKPLGFSLVKVLRDRCYHNPVKGILRDSCEVDMDELAKIVRVSRTTLFKEFRENTALQQFVRRIPRHHIVDGKWHQATNVFQVCMDDPIHPDDMAAYDDLRAQKEMERDQPLPTRLVVGADGKPYEYKSRTLREKGASPKSADSVLLEASTFPKSADSVLMSTPNALTMSADSAHHIDNLPPGVLTKESLTPPAAAFPPINPPQGDPEPVSEIAGAWEAAQPALQASVNAPTYHTHLKQLQTLYLETGEPETVVLLAKSAFSREWLERRHMELLTIALSDALGRPVAVRLTLVATP